MTQPLILHQEGNQTLHLYPHLFASRFPSHELEKSEWITTTPWVQNKIKVFGKEYNEPRLTYWMGPAYQYSSIQWPAKAFSAIAEVMRQELTKILQFPFNSCLLNYYRDGQDSMGAHRDNEPEMDTRCIASVTFGGSRKIKFKNRITQEKIELVLHHGDLLVMHHFQDQWYHEIPKVKSALPRLNLTFRNIIA